jgi:hypothetical protein
LQRSPQRLRCSVLNIRTLDLAVQMLHLASTLTRAQ